MESTLTVSNPDAIELTLTVKMPLREWKALRDQLQSDSYPSFALRSEIHTMVHKATVHFEPDKPAAGPIGAKRDS